MLIYEGIKSEFMQSIEDDSISIQIEKNILERMNRRTSASEFRSWENSLRYMYIVLNDRGIPDRAGIAIEYNIPQTSKRVDFIITGWDRRKKREAIIIELKQWETIGKVQGKDGLVRTFTGNAQREVVHPSYQALSYSQLIRDYNESVQAHELDLAPCAYLHNYIQQDRDPLTDAVYQEYIGQAGLCAADQGYG